MQDVCHMNFVIGLAPIESLWLNGKALEHGIGWSEAQFLIGTQSFSLSHACDKKKKNLFLYFFTELKTYYLSYSFYKNDNDDYNDMIMLITMIMLTRTNDNGYDKDNYRDPWGQY